MRPISYSQISKYQSCGWRYYLTYNHERPPQNSAMLCGSSIHKAIEKDMSSRIYDDEWLDKEVYLNHAMEYAKRTLKEQGLFITEDEDKRKVLIDLFSKIEYGVEIYSNIPKDIFSPIKAEEPILMDTQFGVPIVMYLDMIDKDYCIWDFKTSKKKQNRKLSLQSLLYIIFFEKKYEFYPKFKYLNIKLVKNRDNSPQWWIDELKIDNGQRKKYEKIIFNRIESFLEGVNKNYYPPGKDCFGCYFKKICKYYI